MFAALLLISLSGIVIFLALSLLSHLLPQALARKRAQEGDLTIGATLPDYRQLDDLVRISASAIGAADE